MTDFDAFGVANADTATRQAGEPANRRIGNPALRAVRRFPASPRRRVAASMPLLSLALSILTLTLGSASAETTLLYNGIIHTGTGETFTNGGVIVENGKITSVLDGKTPLRLTVREMIDLKRQHLYPGLIAVHTVLGLTEIEAVRATQDTTEPGDYKPEVQSWIAVAPDSELLSVARANGIAAFQPVPLGGVVSGQSALLGLTGWTFEEMMIKKPVALHVVWPQLGLNTTPKDRSRDPSKWKSLDDQAKDRRAKVRALEEFFDDAKAYATAANAALARRGPAPMKIPAWEAMLPFLRGELPIVVYANDPRQISAAVAWASTNHFKIYIAGGSDAWMVADLLATNKVPVIYERTFDQPGRDTESYDVHFHAPEILRRAGVKVVFSIGVGGFSAASARNLPYAASQAIAFGLPEEEALKGITLYAAELMGVSDRLGSIQPGKDATFFVCDGDLFDLRASVKEMWISGQPVNLETKHTRLYEKYRGRPKP